MDYLTIKDIEPFKNKYGSYTKDVKGFNIPIMINYEGNWINLECINNKLVLVSKSIAQTQIKNPVKDGEQIMGFKRAIKGYIPLFNRPEAENNIHKSLYKILEPVKATGGLQDGK